MSWLYNLRYPYVFKIDLCTYFKQGIWADQIHLQSFETLIFHGTATIKLGIILLVWRVSKMGEYANNAT